MPSSYSTSLRFEEQLTGENLNTWGAKLSNTLQRVDDAIAGFVSIAIIADYQISSSNSNSAADEARMAHLKFTSSTLVSTTNITLPGVSKNYWIWNATNKSLVFTTGSGTTATVETTDVVPIWVDSSGNVKSTTYGGYNLKDYIASQVLASSTALPGQVGNAGKFVKTDGSTATWQFVASTDLSDYATFLGKLVAIAIAF